MPHAPPSPLAVLLAAMRRKWRAGDVDGACALARVAAPYVHGRRAAVREENAGDEARLLSDEQLRRLLDDGGTGAG